MESQAQRQALHEIESEIKSKNKRIKELYDERNNQVCPHCGRELSFGSMSANSYKVGCYPPIGEDRDNYDCDYYQEYGRSYVKKLDGLQGEILELRHQISGLEDLKARILKVGEDEKEMVNTVLMNMEVAVSVEKIQSLCESERYGFQADLSKEEVESALEQLRQDLDAHIEDSENELWRAG